MRWKSLCGGIALLLAGTAGCTHRVFMPEDQYNQVQTDLVNQLDKKPDLPCHPITPITAPPPTLYDLDRKIRFLSLAEAVAIALEQGTVGQPSLLFPGIGLDNLVQFTGQGVSGSDAIRVLALDPSRVGTNIDAALSKFDTLFVGSMNWSTTDQPIGTPLQTFQAGSSGVNAIQQEQATGSLQLLKPLPTGGVAGVTFNLPYTSTNLPARVNPNYQPQLLFQFEQPLLQGFGVEINQLRNAHPGSLLNPGVIPGAVTAEGIVISRIRFDQQRAEFERNVIQMLLNVETAYWNLYGSYWALYSREQGLRFAFESYRSSKAKYEAGNISAGDFYQARGQYELFRAQRLQAIDTVLDNERQLRALLGMVIEDGCRLMPSDAPTLAPYRPDWKCAQAEALERRPELFMARQDVKAAQLNVLLAKNLLLPDLRFTSSYDWNGIGTRLDGGDDPNAIRSMVSGKFSDWTLGLRMTMPLGYRFAHSQLRQAELALARSLEVLKDQELKAQRFLALQYRRISSAYEQIKAQRAQREAFGEQLRARNEEFLAGRKTIDILLEAQRFWADALANEYAAIVTYNNALCGFEYAKGTIMQHDNITIAEGPLPDCAQERAVEHLRQRTAALVLRERANPDSYLPQGGHGPAPTDAHPATLPQMLQTTPPLKDVPSLPAIDPHSPPAAGGAGMPSQLPAPTESKLEDLVSPPTGNDASKPAGNGTGTSGSKPAAPKDADSAQPTNTIPSGLPGGSTLPPIGATPSSAPKRRVLGSDFGTLRPEDPLP
jgi:outer membrane protein TolC